MLFINLYILLFKDRWYSESRCTRQTQYLQVLLSQGKYKFSK
uniref:Uncharacterized protein n=1 Tax=Anguilla anguilla TaxID=7936 RepID=A0A0E9W0D7_ANGAN